MPRLRIGIDVGGTNTDAVLVDETDTVVASQKAPTTSEPLDGIRNVMTEILRGVDPRSVSQAMLGTTHPANAIIQRRELSKVAALRLAAPSSLAIRPGAAWPQDLHQTVLGYAEIREGGFEFDGTEIASLDEEGVRRFAKSLGDDIAAVAVTSAFAPASPEHERRAQEILAEELGKEFPVSSSNEIGTIGMLERENATILNASLLGVARRVVHGFRTALEEHGLAVDSYLTQNDGTLMNLQAAARFPILTVGSGPTNSMRGACALAGTGNAIVIDVGGTSADTGILVDGFPRESSVAVEVGGVRTNFRMPDLISIGLGGGSIVRGFGSQVAVGPDSVGYRVTSEALACGGSTLTLSDVGVHSGRLRGFGDPAKVSAIDTATVAAALAWTDEQIGIMSERIKASRAAVPVIAVGGGSYLIPESLQGVSEVIRPESHAVANAYGAAIAEASGAVERVYRYDDRGRDECIAEAKQLAVAAAVRAGADPDRMRITSVIEVPLTYLPGKASRVQVKAVAPLERR